MAGRHYRLSLGRMWYVLVVFFFAMGVVSWKAVTAVSEIALSTSAMSAQMQELMIDQH